MIYITYNKLLHNNKKYLVLIIHTLKFYSVLSISIDLTVNAGDQI